MEQNVVSFLVLLDHSKDFDIVDHDILFEKSKNNFTFLSSAVKLIRTYLYKRSQTVQNGNVKSFSSPVQREQPQDSILGPLVYTMYPKDLHSREGLPRT